MNKLGIITYYVTGKANNEAHAWNIVKLDNGYYNVDLTWKEFNISDKEYAATHERSDYSSQLPTCVATTYTQVKQTTKTTNSSSNKTTKSSPSVDNNSTNNNQTIKQVENKENNVPKTSDTEQISNNVSDEDGYGKTEDLGIIELNEDTDYTFGTITDVSQYTTNYKPYKIHR